MAEPLIRIERPAESAAERARRGREGVIALLERSGSPLAGRVRTVRELAAAATAPRALAWSAALPALAALFPAGLPCGELVELVGRRSSGRFGLVLALLAAATGVGESVALVDLGDALDPGQARRGGVELTRLLWARPRDTRQTLAAAEALVGGGFPLVVVELGLPPLAGGRGAEAHWLRLARAARESGTLAFVSSPYRVGGVATGIVLEIERARPRWAGSGAEPRLLVGVESRIEPVRGGERRVAQAAPLRLAAS